MPAPFRSPRPAVVLLLFAARLALGAPAPDAAPAPPAPKPYALFVGVDMDVLQKDQFYRVRGVVGSSVVVTAAHGVELRIPMRDQSLKLRIRESLKLTDATVDLADLKAERAYTPGADPARQWARMGATVDMSNPTAQLAGTQDALNRNIAQVNDPTLRPEIRAAIAQMTPTLQVAADNAARSYAQAANDAGSDLYSTGYNAMRMQQELDKQLFDAMAVSFQVSSPQPLTDAYMVLLAQYHDPNEPKGTARNWIYAEALGRIDARPRSIEVRQGGFPPGFELEEFHVHIYDHGREAASNLAKKRVALSRDEAFQYLQIEYLAGHKGATLPPAVALGRLPAEARAALTAPQLTRVCFVKVSKDGLPGDVFLDEACTRRLGDAAVAAIIRECRFEPALDHGRPVEGVAPLKLVDLGT